MERIFKRSEVLSVKQGWCLVYGRRKVGKTFMLKNFINWDIFILIGREGTIWVDGVPLKKFNTIEEMLDLVISSLQGGKKIVIDEFQRLPFEIIERIGTLHPSGKLILSGSSMAVVSRV